MFINSFGGLKGVRGMLDAFWEWLFNRQNITLLIAVAGFVMSIYNFIKDFIQNRTRIRIDIQDCFRLTSSGGTPDIIHIKLLNLSKRPVVLSAITIKNGSRFELRGKRYRFGSYRRKIVSRTHEKGGILEKEEVWFSDVLPVKIEEYGCANLLIMADDNDPVFRVGSRHLIKFHTARRTIRKVKQINDLGNSLLLLESREPSYQK
jgi:hypothetical protein